MNRLAVAAALVALVAVLTLPASASANPNSGQRFGRLGIPAVGISFPLYEGDRGMCDGANSETLDNGVSHYPCSAFPWEIGTVFIAGHRTTHAAPFKRLNEVKPGMLIRLRTRWGEYTYEVVRLKIVRPWVTFNPEIPERLLLSTCYPAGSDAYRLIIFAKAVKVRNQERG